MPARPLIVHAANCAFAGAPAATTYAVLYAFGEGPNGADPKAGLISDSRGNLYGTTMNGGASGKGIVYMVSLTGTSFTVLHSGGGNDGAYPFGSLVADSSGNLYGTASIMGSGGYGVI